MKRFTILVAVAVGLGGLAAPSIAQVRKAERSLKRDQLEDAHGFVKIALESDPENARAFDILARIHLEQARAGGEDYLSHMSNMKDAYMQAVALDEKRKDDVERALLIAYVDEFGKGIDQFNLAQAAEGDSARTSHFMESARSFEGSSIVAPDSAGAYVNWAYATMGAGDDVGAIRPLLLALEHGIPDLDVYNYLGRILLTNGREAEAVSVLEEGVDKFPDDEVLQEFLLNAYVTSGQLDRAINAYAVRVKQVPDNKIYLYNLGSLLLQSERYDEAISQLTKAIEHDPEYVDAFYNLGAAYVNKANDVNQQIIAMDDDVRERKDSIPDTEKAQMESQMQELSMVRQELFSLAIAPLETARSLGESAGRDVKEMCRALYQSYGQTNQTEKIADVDECADF